MTDFFNNSPQGVPVLVDNTPIIHQSSVILTDTQIKTFAQIGAGVVHLTGKPGINKILLFQLGVTLAQGLIDSDGRWLNPYNGGGTVSSYNIVYGDNDDDASLLANSQLFEGSKAGNIFGPQTLIVSDFPNALAISSIINSVNKELSIGMNATDVLGGGNSANTLLIAIEFRVLAINLGRLLTISESGWNPTTRTFN